MVELRRDGRHNSDGTVTIGDIILQNKCRARLLNFCTQGGIKIDEINLAPPRSH